MRLTFNRTFFIVLTDTITNLKTKNMNPIIRNILAVLAGIFIGSSVNMGLIMLSGHVIPPPVGVNPENLESLKANIHLFEPKHFLFPFLAHALGTFVGAVIAALIAVILPEMARTLSLVVGKNSPF